MAFSLHVVESASDDYNFELKLSRLLLEVRRVFDRELHWADGLETREQLRIYVCQHVRSLRRQNQLQEGSVHRVRTGLGLQPLS